MAFFAPFLIGLPIWGLAEKRLRRGFLDDVWSERELEFVRAMLAQPLWRWGGLMVVAAAVFSLTFRTRTNAGSFVYILLLPLQTATRLRQMLTPSLGGKDGLIDWQNFKPIRSEHWGKPVNRFGDVAGSRQE
jgi:hypothetical protein